MIVDAAKGFAAGTARYDVCIVGAGAAGITLALELGQAGLRVCLLEAGGRGYERRVQDLFHGEVDAVTYPPLRETRLAAFGGTTGVWAGWCRPLESLDFEGRQETGADGWPLGLPELRPYYERAHRVCGLGPFEYAPEAWASAIGSDKLLDGDEHFVNRLFFARPQHFGLRYEADLGRSKSADVVLHAPVVRIVGCDTGSVEAVEVRDEKGNTFSVMASRFVLAAGGIENPRLLLDAGHGSERLGNGSGLVGRYFSDHAFVDFGTLVLENAPSAMRFYLPAPIDAASGASVRGVWSLREAAVRRSGLLNAALFLYPSYEGHPSFESDAVKALLQLHARFAGRAVPGDLRPCLARVASAPHAVVTALLRKLLVRNGPSRRWRLRAMYESEPRYENRVTLSRNRDRLGRSVPKVTWRLGDRDVASMRWVTGLFERQVASAGIGRLVRSFADEPSEWRAAAEGGKHHMGTTRMHRDPRLGVVDEHCRVHGTSNLFVAGSAVFPSGGYANPTLTIVALAIRLADYLKSRVPGESGGNAGSGATRIS